MASGKKRQDKRPSGGGTLSGMRAGMQRMAGGSGGKRPTKKAPPNFVQVFTWVLGAALLLVVFYLLARR